MIYWVIFIISEIARNYYIIEVRKQRPNYGGLFIWRSFWGLVCYVVAHRHGPDPILGILDNIPFIVFQLTSFWVFFDIGLNMVRKKPFRYNGANSGWLDDIDEVFSERLYWLLKIIALFTMVWSIIYIS